MDGGTNIGTGRNAIKGHNEQQVVEIEDCSHPSSMDRGEIEKKRIIQN